MDPMRAQNPWAITAVHSSRAVQQFLFIRVLLIVHTFEVAKGMDPMCAQNPWAITAVHSSRAVQQFLFIRVLLIVHVE